jgi:hypothetical protein
MNLLNESRGEPRWSDDPSLWLGAEPAIHRGKERQLVTKIYTGHISAPDQTWPGSKPASYTIGSGSFPGIKRPGRSADHPPHLPPKLNKE